MRTIRMKVYEFRELSKEVQQKVILELHNINIHSDWGRDILNQAKTINIELHECDMYTHCSGEFISCAADTANMILMHHGKGTELYKIASKYFERGAEIEKKAIAGKFDGDEDYWYSEDIRDIEASFLIALLEHYRIALKNEYERRVNMESIIETIELHRYEFMQDGKII